MHVQCFQHAFVNRVFSRERLYVHLHGIDTQ